MSILEKFLKKYFCNKPRYEGREALALGHKLSTNPYPPETVEHREWNRWWRSLESLVAFIEC